MEIIEVTGIKENKSITVRCERENKDSDWNITFDGKRNVDYYDELLMLIEDRHPFGGTFFPEDEKSIYYLIAALEVWFFDKPPDMRKAELVSDELVQMPCENGVQY